MFVSSRRVNKLPSIAVTPVEALNVPSLAGESLFHLVFESFGLNTFHGI